MTTLGRKWPADFRLDDDQVFLPPHAELIRAVAYCEGELSGPGYRIIRSGADPDDSHRERRWITFGSSAKGRVLTVAHTDEGDVVRITSARKATPHERRFYEEG